MIITRSLKFVASAFVAVLTLAAGVPAAQAQFGPRQADKVTVPFAFEIGSKHFAPGTYTVGLQNGCILRVANEEQSATLMVNRDGGLKITDTGKAVFQRVGDKYFLTQVWTVGSSDHLVSVKTREFKAAQRVEEASLHSSQPETMTLALLQ